MFTAQVEARQAAGWNASFFFCGLCGELASDEGFTAECAEVAEVR